MPGITRRKCLQALAAAGLLATRPRLGRAAERSPAVRHFRLAIEEGGSLDPPDGMVTGFRRFGWQAFTVAGTDLPPARLAAMAEATPDVPDGADCRLRLTTALDVRDDHRVEVSTPDGQRLGELIVRFASLYQPQEMQLSPAQARAILQHGAVLRMTKGSRPLWFFAPAAEACPQPDAVQLPHVLVASAGGDPRAEFERRIRGLGMLQGFGWQSGCVSEGLLDLAEARRDAELLAVVDRYLDMYFTANGVECESPRSSPVKDRVGGIEEPLPWATLARRRPDHPAIDIGRKFLSSSGVARKDVSRGASVTTEGNFTAAYPTARLATLLDDRSLADIALRQLEYRRLACVHDGWIYQRATMGGDKRLPNWCRGVCWYYLGLVRTLEALDDSKAAQAWRPEIVRVARLLFEHQRDDGLWGNFLHDSQSAVDTSGSAGLAAALARAHAAGWLDASARQAADRALAGLRGHLTPDGLLGGAAQGNKGGDALQKSDYRVPYPMAMGLKMQLMAAITS